MARLLIKTVDCDPNFERFEQRCLNYALQNVGKYRHVLHHQNLSFDRGACRPLNPSYLVSHAYISLCLKKKKKSLFSVWCQLQVLWLQRAPSFSSLICSSLYRAERDTITGLTGLMQKHRIDAIFVAEVSYSTMQDAPVKNHDVAVVRQLIRSGTGVHTKVRNVIQKVSSLICGPVSDHTASSLPI